MVGNNTPKELLASALKTSSSPAIVRTTFDLPPAQCAATEHVIRETLGMETQVQFETTP
jgi:F-type H+-transporting ATPase subunit b